MIEVKATISTNELEESNYQYIKIFQISEDILLPEDLTIDQYIKNCINSSLLDNEKLVSFTYTVVSPEDEENSKPINPDILLASYIYRKGDNTNGDYLFGSLTLDKPKGTPLEIRDYIIDTIKEKDNDIVVILNIVNLSKL